jgi:hypothetical protein
LTETITQKGQSAIEIEAGLRDGSITWLEAFKEVAPQTFLLTTIMAGAGQVSVTAVNKAEQSLKNEIGEDNPLYETLKNEIAEAIEEARTRPEMGGGRPWGEGENVPEPSGEAGGAGEIKPTPEYTDPSRIEELSATDFEDDASRQEYIIKLRRISEENIEALENQIIKVTGVEPTEVIIKSIHNFNKKIEHFLRDSKDPRNIPDVTTAMIEVNENDMLQYLEKIRDGFEVINDNDLDIRTNEKGEKFINVNVMLPSGTLSQIQIYAKETVIPSEGIFIQWDPKDEVEPGRNRVIKELYESVKKKIIPKKILRFWEVDENEAQIIEKNTRFKVEGYIHILDPQQLKHILDEHGDPEHEAKRGQVAITETDFQLIPDIIRNPDSIERTKTYVWDKRKKMYKLVEGIKYTKRVDGHIIYIEEVLTGQNQLSTGTIYKYIH